MFLVVLSVLNVRVVSYGVSIFWCGWKCLSLSWSENQYFLKNSLMSLPQKFVKYFYSLVARKCEQNKEVNVLFFEISSQIFEILHRKNQFFLLKHIWNQFILFKHYQWTKPRILCTKWDILVCLIFFDFWSVLLKNKFFDKSSGHKIIQLWNKI